MLRVFDTSGNAVTGVVDLNTFYGYPAAINRGATPVTFGPSVTDPSCYFDVDTQRWFHVVLTLDRRTPTSQALSGKNHLDLAVSTSANPLGGWIVYRIPVQNDGTDGTPDHGTRGQGGAGAAGGTELFLSSQAVFNDSGTHDRLRLWKLSGTRSLDRASPSLTLSADTVTVLTYGVPPQR